MAAIAYHTTRKCIGKIASYYVFHDTLFNRYGVVKDEEQDLIHAPYCAYYLDSILKLKGFSNMEIKRFKGSL